MFSASTMKFAFTLLLIAGYGVNFRAKSMPVEATSVHKEVLDELWSRVHELELKYNEVKQQNEELWVLITTAHAGQARGQTGDGKSTSRAENVEYRIVETLGLPIDRPITVEDENLGKISTESAIASGAANTKQLKDLLMWQDVEMETLSENQHGLADRVSDLERKVQKERGAFVKAGVNNSVIARSEDLVEQMREFMAQLEATVKRKCAFSAARSTVMLGSLESQVITYDKLMANKGKSFDRNTGIFTAQTPGIYYFSFNVRSYDGKHIGITLMKNEETTTAIATDAGDRKVAQSQSIMLQLEVGDRVWLQLGPHKEYAIYSNSFNYVTFNGFLIYANFR
ncbi:uncharacterized protein LOC102802000 [Saccoglossus kowalevskii]